MPARGPKYIRARGCGLQVAGGLRRIASVLFACAVFAGLNASASGIFAQSINLQPGSDTGTQLEKFPTPRDPSYVPPLLPQSTLDSANQTELGGSALIFSAGGSGDLVSLFAERRAAQLEAARRADRYGERNAQYLDETGQDRALLEQNLQRQLGSSRGLPRDFGKSHYSETPGRRFSVVFLLSLPITAGIVGGLYQAFGPGVNINGPADYPAMLGILGAGSIFSALIGYYDYTETQAARNHAVGHRAREAYDLRNHPFGRRGVKDSLDPQSGDAKRDGADASSYLYKAWRTAAADEARRLLNANSFRNAGNDAGAFGPGDSGRSRNLRDDDPARLLNFRWRFAY